MAWVGVWAPRADFTNIRKGTYLYARIYSFFFVVVVVVVARRAGVEEAEDPWFFCPYLIVFDRESIADRNPSVLQCSSVSVETGGREKS